MNQPHMIVPPLQWRHFDSGGGNFDESENAHEEINVQ